MKCLNLNFVKALLILLMFYSINGWSKWKMVRKNVCVSCLPTMNCMYSEICLIWHAEERNFVFKYTGCRITLCEKKHEKQCRITQWIVVFLNRFNCSTLWKNVLFSTPSGYLSFTYTALTCKLCCQFDIQIKPTFVNVKTCTSF